MSPTPLQIKVKALQRLTTEKSYYAKEVAENTQTLEQMRANGADPYEVKKQSQVLDESKRMVPELDSKIKEHAQNLSEFLKVYNGDEDTTFAKSLIQ
ncbi:CIC11C00000002660 [Sungouiella intermedia]|uniref:Tubulin-specific chaperone A n=1 Tax=Sungouiella intermedia TaxID=45354 RepID=A0A1L0BJJ0_9ASCO|nr:CIC11C00000002660 [[Candida] intermedia]